LTDKREDLEELYRPGKTAIQGAALKLAKDAVKALEDWQRPKTPRYRSEPLGEEEYSAMLECQGGVCAICKEAPKNGRLHVDDIHGSDKSVGFFATFATQRWDSSKMIQFGWRKQSNT